MNIVKLCIYSLYSIGFTYAVASKAPFPTRLCRFCRFLCKKERIKQLRTQVSDRVRVKTAHSSTKTDQGLYDISIETGKFGVRKPI